MPIPRVRGAGEIYPATFALLIAILLFRFCGHPMFSTTPRNILCFTVLQPRDELAYHIPHPFSPAVTTMSASCTLPPLAELASMKHTDNDVSLPPLLGPAMATMSASCTLPSLAALASMEYTDNDVSLPPLRGLSHQVHPSTSRAERYRRSHEVCPSY
jgi:hypothetical protein